MNDFGFTEYNINGVIPVNTGTADAEGTYWTLQDDVGGWDSPDMRVSMLTKIGNTPRAQGEIPSDLHYRGRSIVMTIYGHATTEVNRQASKYLLAGALDLTGATGTFYVYEEVPKQITIVRSGNSNQGKLTYTDLGYTTLAAQSQEGDLDPLVGIPPGSTVYLFKAELEFYAEDPFKYTQEASTADLSDGTLNIANSGNTPSSNMVVTLTDTGGGDGPISLTLGSLVMQIRKPTVPAGAPTLGNIPSTLVIDFYNETIEDADGNNYYYLRNLETPMLVAPVGTTELAVSPDTIGGSISYYPAWV
jgi:hypothetical protein